MIRERDYIKDELNVGEASHDLPLLGEKENGLEIKPKIPIKLKKKESSKANSNLSFGEIIKKENHRLKKENEILGKENETLHQLPIQIDTDHW